MAEPTHNEAERALRRAVLWRRKSFGTQSEEGSRFVGRILTVVASLRQQGRDVLGFLVEVCPVVRCESRLYHAEPPERLRRRNATSDN